MKSIRQRDPYRDSKGRPTIKHSYCVLMDVLGFHSFINRKSKPKDARRDFRWFHQIMSARVHDLNRRAERSPFQWKTKVFTDNLVLGGVYDVRRCVADLAHLFDAVTKHQLEMALENCFVRGALAVGPLFIDPDVVYGTALLDAHRIESTILRRCHLYRRIS